MLTDTQVFALVTAPFIGSFLGLLALRLPDGRGFALGRSACDHCGRVLGPPDLVPLISWFVLRGRSRCCSLPLGLFYPAIEMAAIGVALWASLLLDGWVFWTSCVLGWTLLALAVIDWRHLILPDGLTLPLIAAGLLVTAAIDSALLPAHVAGAVAGYGVFAATSVIYRRARGRDGLGLGDAKLLAAGGAWLSWQALPGVVLIASLTALSALLVARLLGHLISRDDRVPFGPCICIAIWVVWLHGPLQFS